MYFGAGYDALHMQALNLGSRDQKITTTMGTVWAIVSETPSQERQTSPKYFVEEFL